MAYPEKLPEGTFNVLTENQTNIQTDKHTYRQLYNNFDRYFFVIH